MKQKLLLKVMLLLCALVAGSSSVWATPTEVISFSRSGNSNTYTSGYTFSAAAEAKSGYYQDGSGTERSLMLYHTTNKLFASAPDEVTFTAKLGGGTTKDPLGNNVYVCFVDKSGNVIEGSSVVVTTKITSTTGSDFSVNMSTSKATDAYGVKIYHTKETGYNVRYYSFSLSYEAGSSGPTIAADPTSLSPFTYVLGNGPSATQTISVSGSNLTEDITIEVSEGNTYYEVSTSQNSSYASSVILSQTEGAVSATNVYVRLKDGLTKGNYAGKLTLSSDGADEIEVDLSGSATTLAVTYDANGADSGTAPEDATAYTYNAYVTVRDNTGSLAKTGYTFDGWTTESDGTGDYYLAGEKFYITSNTTLYAVWTVNVHTVTLPDDDIYGEYTMDGLSSVAYGTEVTLAYTPNAGYEKYVATWSVNGSPISGNKFTMPDADVTITVNLAEIFDMTLSNGDIVAADDAADSYNDYEIEDTNGKTWNAYAIKKAHSGATSSYHFLQIKKYASSTAYYIQVPEYGRKITKLEMTVSGGSQPMTGGGNTATLFFSASNSTSATGTGVASGTGSSKVTIDCSSLNLNTGYITAGGAVRIWDVKVTYDPIRLNGSGYATYAGLTPINYSDDSKFSAWAISGISGNAITFSKITGSVPAGTGVLLMGTAGQAVEPVVAASGTAPETNWLTGITTATEVAADTYYGLSGNKFVKVNAGTVPAGRALLPASKIPSSAPEFSIVFDNGNTTGIAEVRGQKEEVRGEVYDLQGRKVAQPSKGLYIVNGKKFVIK